MDVPQRSILKAACRQLRPGNRAVGAGGIAHVAVKTQQMDPAVFWGGKTLQRGPHLLRREEGRAINHTVQFRQQHRLQSFPAKDMDVFRPSRSGVGAVGCVGVVVARRNEYRTAHPRQRLLQALQGFRKHPLSVEQIACQQHKLGALRPDQLRQTLHHLTALPAAFPGLVPGQSAEGAVQMEVRSMYDFRHIIPPAGCTHPSNR